MIATALAFFLPGRLVNPLNVSRFGLWRHRRWAKALRTQAAEIGRVAVLRSPVWRDVDPATPKRIEFLAILPKRLDDDGIGPALKPARDGLADAGIIHHDGPRCGHHFVYVQRGTRGEPPGVQITIELRTNCE